jgi:hypothetical protein
VGIDRRVLVLALLSACSPAKSPGPRIPEDVLRARLGIPASATTVIIFAQNSHLDIDWQKTLPDYYQTWVERILLEARQMLDASPRAYYSIAEMAYLEHHLAMHPEELDPLKKHAARGAFRIVGGGMTSPDSNLPETEILIRDYLYGTKYSEDTFHARPYAAWVPDSFGHSATFPDVLTAMGFESVAMARIDGAPGLFDQFVDENTPPLPGSTAESLASMGSADFVWRGAGGSEIFAHWMPHRIYCRGDTIDYDEPNPVPGGHLGAFKGDDPQYVDNAIVTYAAEMERYRKTPYIFVPVGCDFQRPKMRLVEYLEAFNQRSKGDLYAVSAPFEDYALLVLAHKDRLPIIEGDLGPYFTGYFGSRAEIKRRTRAAARSFFAAECFASALGDVGRTLLATSAPDLERLTLSDHHDFVSGTSLDPVVATEQLPLLSSAEAAGQAAMARVGEAIAARIPTSSAAAEALVVFNPAGVGRSDVLDIPLQFPGPVRALANGAPVPLERIGPMSARVFLDALQPWSWRTIDMVYGTAGQVPGEVTLDLLGPDGAPATEDVARTVVLRNARVRAEWALRSGLRSLAIDGVEALGGPSFRLEDYDDQGGLYRIGSETTGCRLTPVSTATSTERLIVRERTALRIRIAFATRTSTREIGLDAGAEALDLALETAATEGRTRTAGFVFASPSDVLVASQAGGFASRPASKLYLPTFWPAVSWVMVGSWAVLLRQSTGASLDGAHLALMAVRDVRSEQCDTTGAAGSDVGPHRIEWRLARAERAADAGRAAEAFDRPLVRTRAAPLSSGSGDLPREQSLASIEGPALLSALKPAERGAGLIVRVLLMPGPATLHLSPALRVRAITRVDALERDLEKLAPSESLQLDRAMFGPIATLRLE